MFWTWALLGYAQNTSYVTQTEVNIRCYRKLKRDSGPPLDAAITETDRLLLQKDEEVSNTVIVFNNRGKVLIFSNHIFHCF